MNRESDVTHIEIDRGFWCLSEENNDNDCEDYRVSFCCPTFSEGSCTKYGSVWDSWIDRDDPDGVGDVELRIGYISLVQCQKVSKIFYLVYLSNAVKSDPTCIL